jgi:hypothetical protein
MWQIAPEEDSELSTFLLMSDDSEQEERLRRINVNHEDAARDLP